MKKIGSNKAIGTGTQGNSKRGGNRKRRSCGRLNYGVSCYHCNSMAPHAEPVKGLRELIAIAKSEKEINTLLEEGWAYAWASRSTQKRWRTTANKRLSELSYHAQS